MNKKELEKMRKRFFAKANNRLFQYPCETCGERDCERSHQSTDISEIWQWIEKEVKEAYHKGYMAGTMEAL